MSENNKLSWSLSLVIHGAIAAAVIYSGVNYLTPDGEVIDVDINSTGVQTEVPTEAQEIKAPPTLPEKAPVKAVPKAQSPAKAVVVPKVAQPKSESKPVLQKYEEAPVAAPLDTSDTTAEEEAPEAEEKPQVAAAPVPVPEPETQAEPETTPEAQPTEEEAAAVAPVAAPPVAAAVPTEGTGQDNVIETPNAKAVGAEAPPKFGTPGTTIAESRLSEQPGNQRFNYPWMSKMRKQEGTVVVAAFVQKNGTISHVKLLRSSGHPGLDQEVLQTYPKWKFNSGPTGWVVKPVSFKLKK